MQYAILYFISTPPTQHKTHKNILSSVLWLGWQVLVVMAPCRSVLCRNLQFAVAEFGAALCHDVVEHPDPWFPSWFYCLLFSLPEHCSYFLMCFSSIVSISESCSPTISSTYSLIVCSVQLIFSFRMSYSQIHIQNIQQAETVQTGAKYMLVEQTKYRATAKTKVLIRHNTITSEIIQESPADAMVSARQCRHLAIKFEVGHRSCDRSSNLCSHLAKVLELRK